MASIASVRAWKMFGRRESENRSKGLRGKKLYAILLGVLPVVEENILLRINCMQGSTLGQKETSLRA